MVENEWLRRYKQAFKDTANLTDAEAAECAGAVSFEEASRGFEDDPEGAAQMEMSYWDS
jgi:hypothetical protein